MAAMLRRLVGRHATHMIRRNQYQCQIRRMCASKDKNLKCLYDGECPLCMKEINWLKSKDTEGKVEWIDIADDDFDETVHQGIDYRTAMESMHVIDMKSQSVQKGIHAFKPMYDQVGMGWIWTFTKVPIISTIADSAYNLWARQRMRVTGRPSIDIVCKQREERLAQKARNSEQDSENQP